jgi:YggT family protein
MVLLDTVTAVEHFLDVFVGVYTLAIFLYVLASWIPLPYAVRPVQRFLNEVCEPYIRLWRRILPTAGPIDLSPMVAVIALIVVDRIAAAILERLH